MMCPWKQLLSILPPGLRREMDSLESRPVQELRLRLHAPPEVVLADKSLWLSQKIPQDDLNFVVNPASRYSPWAAATAAQGYLTAPGGHRIGQLEQDVAEGNLYVVTAEETIHGVFFFLIGPDPTYSYIENGAWHADRPYGTIHRIAGDGSGGILHTAVEFGKQRTDYLRIDTHEDNIVMQRAVEKQGFRRCGIIYQADGSPRIAYDLTV